MKRLLSFAMFFCLVVTVQAQNISREVINRTVEKSVEQYFQVYKTLHAHPELSLCEKNTSKLIADQMRHLGLEVTENVGGYGVVGVLRNGNGPVLMLRADMDALPVKEATGLPYASEVITEVNGTPTPVMHACGHDRHSTILLGLLNSLTENKKAWKGTIVAVAQPAEEIGAGARNMIEDGLLTRFPCPDRAFGWHMAPQFPAGTIAYTMGPALAGVRDFDITFYGKGTHGAFPHNGIDPILMAASAVLDYQTIISRNVITTEFAVLTVGAFNGGSRPNIVPEKVELKITTRYFNDAVGDQIEKRIREITNSCAAGFGMDKMPDISVYGMLSPVINNTELMDRALSAMATVISKDNLLESPINMVAEDFSTYSRAIAAQKGLSEPAPTAHFWIGASKSATEISGTLHSPTFHPEFRESFTTAVVALTAAVIEIQQ